MDIDAAQEPSSDPNEMEADDSAATTVPVQRAPGEAKPSSGDQEDEVLPVLGQVGADLAEAPEVLSQRQKEAVALARRLLAQVGV